MLGLGLRGAAPKALRSELDRQWMLPAVQWFRPNNKLLGL